MSQPTNRTGNTAGWIVGILAAIVLGVVVVGWILARLLLPAALHNAREAARRIQSSNNMKQIALAMHEFHQMKGSFPAHAIFDKHGKPLLSWRVQLLPLLEQQQLYDQFHLNEPWDSPHNRSLLTRIPAVYQNPNRPPDGKTNYLVPTGKGTAFDGVDGMTIADIHDGTSNTIMFVEADDDRAVIWTKPDDLEVDLDRPLDGLGNFRPGGFLAGLCDGAVRDISNSVDPQTLKALFTRSGGETIDWAKVPDTKH